MVILVGTLALRRRFCGGGDLPGWSARGSDDGRDGHLGGRRTPRRRERQVAPAFYESNCVVNRSKTIMVYCGAQPAMTLISVNTGRPRDIHVGGETVRTSIWKAPREGRVRAAGVNLDGDEQSDLSVHG